MIEGWEKETKDLSANEERLLPLISAGLKTKIGSDNAIKSGKIIEVMKSYDSKFDGARLRKIISEIRRRGVIRNLIASSKGYYIATDKKDIERYKGSLMGRINRINQILNSYD